MRILGISAFYHDSAAALVEDGRIVAAAQEERFTRKKHDPSFPHNAIAYCLAEGRRRRSTTLDHVVFYDKPFLKFERLLETYLALAPRGFRSFQMAIPLWLKRKAVPEEPAHGRAEEVRAGVRPHQAAVLRASSEPRGVGVLSLAVRERGRADHGRRRRMGDDVGRDRRRQQAGDLPGDPFPAFAGPALFGLHLLHRLQGQLRRIQGDGARALWRAEIRKAHPRPSDRPEAGRLVPARSCPISITAPASP